MRLSPPAFGSRRWIWGLLIAGGCLVGVCRLSFGDATQTQARLPVTLFSDQFTASEYYTNNMQLKYRLTGRKATPLGADRYLVTQLRLEMFEEDGQRQATIEAPECLYDRKARSASSPGPLKIILGDGHMSATGEGFLWQQAQASLMISNHAQARVRELPNQRSKP